MWMNELFSLSLSLPFGAVEITANEHELLRLDFLAQPAAVQKPNHPLLHEAQQQLLAYCADPKFEFSLPWRLEGTAHQHRVWQQIAAIRSGQTVRYLDIAQQIQSSPRAVGGACGRNPLPIIVPCHRVVSAQGLGGFNANRNGLDWMPIKRWLLRHEGVIAAADLG